VILLFYGGVLLWVVVMALTGFCKSVAWVYRAVFRNHSPRPSRPPRRPRYEGSRPKRETKYPADWQYRRIAIFLREDGRCEGCGTEVGEIRANCHTGGKNLVGAHVHHRLALSAGGDHSYSNLQLLCSPCHRARHARSWLKEHRRRSAVAAQRNPEDVHV
jgi:5-methylcytosine-specific restriction protein A